MSNAELSFKEKVALRAAGNSNPSPTPVVNNEPGTGDPDKEPSQGIVAASKLIIEDAAPKGSYIDLRLKWLILADGKKVLPTNGYFVPTNEEEKALLEYFYAKDCGLVERVD